jgi:hypothetical protein
MTAGYVAKVGDIIVEKGAPHRNLGECTILRSAIPTAFLFASVGHRAAMIRCISDGPYVVIC